MENLPFSVFRTVGPIKCSGQLVCALKRDNYYEVVARLPIPGWHEESPYTSPKGNVYSSADEPDWDLILEEIVEEISSLPTQLTQTDSTPVDRIEWTGLKFLSTTNPEQGLYSLIRR